MAPSVQPVARVAIAAGASALAIILATVVFRAPPTQPQPYAGPGIVALTSPPPSVQVPAGSPKAAGTPSPYLAPVQPTGPICQLRTQHVDGGEYIVSNDEYDSSAPECIQTDGSADFTVQDSSIYNTSGLPGAYPDIYKGCGWGNCTYDSGFPIQVSAMAAGDVTTSWSISRPAGSGVYDAAYDIWYNQTPVAPGQPNGAELMVWLTQQGGARPFGQEVAQDVSIGGDAFDVWEGPQHGWDTVSYVLVDSADSVTGLDVGLLTQDAVSRGYIQPSWYLIAVDAGFELWQGGAGLSTDSFSVEVHGAGS